MNNLFDVNKSVATAFVRAEQTKGLFLAQAKLILVLLSGSMMFLGICMAAADVHTFLWSDIAPKVPMLVPVAVVAALLAVAVEGGTIFSSALVKEARKQIEHELSLLDKVKTKFTVAEYDEKAKKIKSKGWLPFAIMGMCCLFSVAGAEVFWQSILQNQPLVFHLIGYLLGIVCSSLLILFEMRSDTVERVIERCLSSSGLIQLALDQSAKSQIHSKLFVSRRELLNSPEFERIITNAAEQGLYGVLEDAVRMSGANVTAQQLKASVHEEIEIRDAANQFLTSGGKTVIETSTSVPQVESARRRVTPQRKVVAKLVREHGLVQVMKESGTYARECHMDRRTLEHWIEDIKQYGV